MKRLLGFAMRRRGTVAMAILMTFAVAGTAFAAARGTTLKMGVTQVLTGNYVTTYAGTVSSALLYLKNSSTNAASSGLRIDTPNGGNPLDLRAKAGFAPMRVNSATKVTNLNADRLDGIDSSVLLNGRLFASGLGNNASGPALVSGANYIYVSSFTPSSSGTCLVNANTQIVSSAANANLGPFYRIAIKRAGVNGEDGFYGHYFAPMAAGYSASMTRSARIPVAAGQAIELGAYLNVFNADWVGDAAGVNLTYNCYTASSPGGLSTSSTSGKMSPAEQRKASP